MTSLQRLRNCWQHKLIMQQRQKGRKKNRKRRGAGNRGQTSARTGVRVGATS